VRLVAVLAVAALVIAGLLIGQRRALTAWLLLAGYLAVDVALIAVARLPIVGTIAGADPRYLADVVPVAVLCASFAFLDKETRAPRQVQVASAALTLAVGAAAVISFLRLAPTLPFDKTRDYVATARAAVSSDPYLVLYDGGVPDDVIFSWFAFDAKPSRVIGPARFDEPTEHLSVLDDGGRPHPVEQLANPVTSQPGPVKDCGYPVEQAVTTIPLSAPATARVLRLEYYTADAGPATVTVAGRHTTVHLERGPHYLFLVVDPPFVRVDINRDGPQAAVCVVSAQIGEPR
jgi:hypothetical protein